MSDTPATDKAVQQAIPPDEDVVPASFARKLERDLNTVRTFLKQTDEHVTDLQRTIDWLRSPRVQPYAKIKDVGLIYLASEIDLHLASSPPQEWEPHDL